MISERLIIIAVFCCIAFGNANPLGDTDVVWPSQSTNAFDGGELNSCVALNVENTSFCNIDYEVPSYVAATAEVLLSEIRGALSIISDRANQADCRATLREVLCAQKFPRCIRGEVGTGIQVQIDFTQNCEQRLQSSCDDRTFSQIQGQYLCGFHNLTEQVRFSDTPCRSVSSYGYDLQVCHTAIDSNTMMTPWMFEILKQKDAVTHRQLNGIGQLVQHDQACLRKWATYFCQSVGQCSRDGTRAELINTVEQCEELLSCFAHELVDSLSDTIPCSLWPNRPLFPEPDSTTSTTYSETVKEIHSTPSRFTPPVPGVLTLSPSSSTVLRVTNFVITLTFIIVLVVSFLL